MYYHVYWEVETCMKHGADKILGVAIISILRPTSYAPRYRTIEERVGYARTAIDFAELCLDMILRGEINEAKKFMHVAVEKEAAVKPHRKLEMLKHVNGMGKMEQYDALGLAKTVYECIEIVPQIVKSGLSEFDRMRAKRGFAPLMDYIDVHVG